MRFHALYHLPGCQKTFTREPGGGEESISLVVGGRQASRRILVLFKQKFDMQRTYAQGLHTKDQNKQKQGLTAKKHTKRFHAIKS